jgi:outer membrane protein assembly factor BamB
MPSRREFLAALSVATVVAGCNTSPTADRPPSPSDPSFDPTKHVAGADGEWSSFGCNAANARTVNDGRAPVDGLSERWRVPVPGLQRRAPVVAGEHVFLPGRDGLRVLAGDDGTELWQAPGVRRSPLVRDGTAYVADADVTALRALNAATGEELWAVSVDDPPAAPTMYPGRPLVFGAGETVHALDPATEERVWTREVFGEVLDSPPVFKGYAAAVATAAGEVSLLRLEDGRGVHRFRPPATPVAPPSAGPDSVYVSCRNGTTYALGDDASCEVAWTADTGWAERGIAVAAGQVVVAAGTTLTAVDTETGDELWTHGMGDWRHTAPCHGRDTLFVGGDRLWALDPTPSGGISSGPAVRFERTFAGRVGPGPVLNDGTVYVVAETDDAEFHLLALEGTG